MAMVRIDGGVFSMGSSQFYSDEQPVHPRRVEPFWIDEYAVTNRQFGAFVADSGYVTVAERALSAADFPSLDPSDLKPGSMVFTPSRGPVDLRDWRQWWRWVPGACWHRPVGPGSTVDTIEDHPVVHVAYEDALAYARWAGGRLPTEAEHEFAARGGLEGEPFAWGAEPYPDGQALANTWIGRFPYINRGRFGASTAPVGSYPPNAYGLYDMIGNTWEWTSDVYAPRHFPPERTEPDPGERRNLIAGSNDADPPRRVLKGGSYLCSPDYCLRFRPAARSPQTEDTSTTHIGFRLAHDD